MANPLSYERRTFVSDGLASPVFWANYDASNPIASSGIVGKNFPFDLQASITVPVVPAVPIVPFVSRPRTCAARAPDEVVWESGGYSERRMGEASMHS
jgi:hypothetical protein